MPAPPDLGAPQEKVTVQAPVTMSPDSYHNYQSPLPTGSGSCTRQPCPPTVAANLKPLGIEVVRKA